MDLASIPVPSVNKNGIARRSRESLGVVDGLPGNLGEGPAPDNLAALHGPEPVLLAVAAVPDPVKEEVRDEKRGKGDSVPSVLRRVVVGKVDGAVAVRKRDTGQIPEDEHESPLLVVHVPVSRRKTVR